MGLPTYNHAWQGVTAGTTHGLYRSATGAAPGTWEAGVIDYRDMYARLQSQPASYAKYQDTVAGVPYVYAPGINGGLFSTFEDPASILRKVNVVTSQQLGGVFFWDLSSDLPDTNADALVRTAGQVLRQAPARVSSVVVNDGSAQRSRVTEFTVTFDKLMTLGTGAITLTGPGSVTVPVIVTTTGSTATQTVVRVTFPPLADGRYTVRVNASQTLDPINRPLDGDANGTPGGDYTISLHRLFGDADGDATVTASDFLAFRLAFLTNNPTFDADGDGQVTANDFQAFRLRYLATV
jgi:hypothetical protein